MGFVHSLKPELTLGPKAGRELSPHIARLVLRISGLSRTWCNFCSHWTHCKWRGWKENKLTLLLSIPDQFRMWMFLLKVKLPGILAPMAV